LLEEVQQDTGTRCGFTAQYRYMLKRYRHRTVDEELTKLPKKILRRVERNGEAGAIGILLREKKVLKTWNKQDGFRFT
jgi:hypothetical protein